MNLIPLSKMSDRSLIVGTLLLISFAVGALAAPPVAPSNLSGYSRTDSDLGSVTFAWEDNSDDEAGFRLEVFVDEAWIFPFGPALIAADSEEFFVNGPFSSPPGNIWRVIAVSAEDEDSEPTNEVTAFTFSGSVDVSAGSHRGQIGEPLTDITITTSTNFTTPEITVAPLPAGVSFDPGTNTISGTPTEGGFFAATVLAREGVNVRKASVAFVVIDPPVVTLTPTPTGISATLSEVDLSTVFNDPDTETTAAIKTNLGDIPLTLFDTTAPISSVNFEGYMDRGDWDNTIIHRSVPGFVIQGGWLTPDDATGKNFSTINAEEPIADEYDDSRPNVETTLAMAKNNPGEATNNWFIGLRDNAQNLDNQAGGFASFARVVGDGMDVVRAIDVLTDATYSGLTINDADRSMDNLPLSEVTAESPTQSQLVIVNSVERIDPLAFELVSNSNPAAVTATLDGGTLTLGFIGDGGDSAITVAATDLDGARTETTFTATVESSYSSWETAATSTGGAAANDDGGTLSNLQEYAFGGDPIAPLDDSTRAPAYTEISVGEETFDAIEFYHHQFSSDLTYTVQMSTDLATWTDLWTTADGQEDDAIAAVDDQGTYTKLTVRAPLNQAASNDARVFFRVLVSLPAPE